MKLRPGHALACLLFVNAAWVFAPLSGAFAEDKPPAASDLLFEAPQMANTNPGDELAYSYSQKSADPEKYGDAFDDGIKLIVEDAGKAPGERTIKVEMFSAERRKPAGPFEGMSGNPILSLMLENNIQQLSKLLGANPRYLKNAIRRALRDAPSAPDQIDGQAKAWKVEIKPFVDDPEKARMKGLETLTYTFRVAPELPGAIYEIDIAARDAAGAVLLEETLRYGGKKS
jgi:hypothetical protein